MYRDDQIIMRNGEVKDIFLFRLADVCTVGSAMYELSDGSLLVSSHNTYITKDYRHFEKTEDYKANSNVVRLKDGRLLGIYAETVENIYGNHLKAQNYYCHFSDDDGKTWYGKSVLSEDNERLYLMNQRPKRLSTGRIILPISLHPNCLLEDTKYFEAAGWVTCFYTDDEGETWHKGEWVTAEMVDQLCEPVAEEMPDGSIKMISRTGRGYLYQCDSFDGGHTWTQEYPTQLRSGVAPLNMGYDPYSKRYVMCWDDSFPGLPHQQPRTPIRVAVSDDGKTWTTVFTLGNNPLGTYGYPAFHFAKDEIHITYYINPGKVWDLNRAHFAAIPRAYDELLLER